MVQLLFWLSAGLLGFHYVGYPLLMLLLSRLITPKSLPEVQDTPPITMIISVYNQEGVIQERLDNCRALDYPRDKLKVLVVSDDSADGTHSIVEQYNKYDIELEVVQGRVGKTGALNLVIPKLDAEIVIFTDANSMLAPDSLKKLVRNFADPRVGGVCGELRLTGNAGAEGVYWRYEKVIKQLESRVSTLTVYNGALYALRRQLHRPMNPQAANDFQHALQVALQGYRSIYEPQAVAEESTCCDAAVEARRRVRIISRGWKGMLSHAQVLNPFKAGIFTVQFIVRKLLRWLGPILMAIALGANIALVTGHLLFSVTLALQCIFYVLAILGLVLEKTRTRLLPAYLPYYFCLINWAALLAIIRVISRRNTSVWTPTTSMEARYQKSDTVGLD